jgi:hypothetical protein
MYDFKDPAGRTRLAVICVAIYMVLDALYGLTLLYHYATSPGPLDPFEVRPADFVAIPMLVMMIVCVVVVGMWIYRASANAHALSDEMTISPGWAVGWYFVPIMYWFRPYQAMREIWLASHFRGNWHGEPAPAILGWWWGLWVVSNILGSISFRLSMSLEDGASLDLVTVLDIASSALSVPLSLTLIAIMRQTAQAQDAARHEETFA